MNRVLSNCCKTIRRPKNGIQYVINNQQNDNPETLCVSNIVLSTSLELGDESNRQARREKCFCTIEHDQGNRHSLFITGYAQTPINSIEDAVITLQHILPNILEKTCQAAACIKDSYNKHAILKLTTDEQTAIYLYTMEWEENQPSLYSLLNSTLRNAHNVEEMKPWFGFLKLFFMALIKLPSIQQIIWRGVKLDLSMDYTMKQEVTWWSISSCTESIDLLKSEQFLGQNGSRTLFSIECCRGKQIMQYSAFPAESEIILLPGTKLQVVSKVALAPDLNIIHLKEIIPTIFCLEMPMTKQELDYERKVNHRKVSQE